MRHIRNCNVNRTTCKLRNALNFQVLLLSWPLQEANVSNFAPVLKKNLLFNNASLTVFSKWSSTVNNVWWSRALPLANWMWPWLAGRCFICDFVSTSATNSRWAVGIVPESNKCIHFFSRFEIEWFVCLLFKWAFSTAKTYTCRDLIWISDGNHGKAIQSRKLLIHKFGFLFIPFQLELFPS